MAPVSTTEDILTAMSSITETAGRLVASATSSARNGSLDVNDIVGTYQDASTVCQSISSSWHQMLTCTFAIFLASDWTAFIFAEYGIYLPVGM